MLGIFIEHGAARLREDLPEPRSAAGDCRVQVLRVGICATDLALLRGYMGFRGVPGHEFVGRALDGPLRGQRVVGEINASCGACLVCRRGQFRHCPDRTVVGIAGRPGALAEQVSIPLENLHRVPDGVSSDTATFTEPLAAAFAVLEHVDVTAGQTPRALVAGDGKLGLLVAAVLAQAGCQVTVGGHHPERVRLLPGGVEFIHSLEEGPAASFDLAVDATGSPAALAPVMRLVRPLGTVILKTTTERPTTLDLSPLVVNEIRLLGSRCGAFEPALEALALGHMDFTTLVSARYPLAEGVAALERAGQPGVLKVLVDVA